MTLPRRKGGKDRKKASNPYMGDGRSDRVKGVYKLSDYEEEKMRVIK